MSSLLTRADLPQDVAACDAVLAQHDGFKADIDAQIRLFEQFESRGLEMIQNGHFMSEEIDDKLKNLKSSFDELLAFWQDRKCLHEQNLDLQLFKKKLVELEIWLQTQEHYLSVEDGKSLPEVDYLMRKHEQFEQKLLLYESKFQELEQKTKIEEEIKKRFESEEQKKNEEEKLQMQRKMEELKKKEGDKLLEERRKERAETELLPNVESDEDLYFRGNLPQTEQRFKRIGSRIYPDKHQDIRPETPVISRKKFSLTPSTPPTTAEGFLDRKQELLGGGKRATSRSWKTYYTVLCGQLLCFFKDKKALQQQKAANPPVNILGAKCSIPKDYHKKKFIFRLEPTDRSAFLFEAANEIKREEWIKKINFTASLHPSKQLMNVSDTHGEVDGSRTSGIAVDNKLLRRLNFTSGNAEVTEFARSENLGHEMRHSIDSISNPTYAIPFDVSKRSSTITTYEDDDLQSARSSFSNQSSYRTALASTSSISTLQDDHQGSSDDDFIYSMPEPRDRRESELSVTPTSHEKVTKHMSLPRESGKKSEGRKIWKAFSLRRNN